MARLDRYMLSQLMVLFGFFALILILVYWVNRAVRLFDQLIADGQSIGVFLMLSSLTVPSLVRIALPIAAFAASVYVANRMMAESELVVVQSTGFSSYRLMRPVFYFGLIVTLLMALLVNYLVPLSTTELAKRQAEVAENATARLLRDGQFLTPTEGVTIYIREVSQSGELLDIFLSDSRSEAETVTYTATRAYIVRTDDGPQLVMVDGMAQTLRLESRSLVTTSFEDLAYNLGTLITMPDATRRSDRELMTWELLSPTPALAEETGRSMDQLRVEGHNRIARSFQPLVAALIGFATLMVGGFSRFGVWKQIIAAIFLIIVVKIVESVVTSSIAGNSALWPLTYLPELFGLLIVLSLISWEACPGWLRRGRQRAPSGAA